MIATSKALHQFWGQFGLEAYRNDSVPLDAAYPYITFEVYKLAPFEDMSLTAYVWCKDDPDGNIARAEMLDRIAEKLVNGHRIPCGNGCLIAYLDNITYYQDPSDPTVKGGRIAYDVRYLV